MAAGGKAENEKMKLIIAGGRDYRLTSRDYDRLQELWREFDVSEIVSGMCSGVDECGEYFAHTMNLPVVGFPADCKTHGKAAGPIRNREMAEYADAVALFPGGRGTQSMEKAARTAGIRVFDFRQ